MSKIHNHKVAVGLIAMVAIGAAAALLLWRTGVGESVKRESARLFDYEYIPNQHVDIGRCDAAAMADSIYKDFRNKYRFHYQTVGMASFADSSRLILLSDIPPHFETDSIAPIFSQFTHKAEQRRHPIGYDGCHHHGYGIARDYDIRRCCAGSLPQRNASQSSPQGEQVHHRKLDAWSSHVGSVRQHGYQYRSGRLHGLEWRPLSRQYWS